MQVNIGTPEQPVMVPEEALHPDTDAGKDWWETLAAGSVTLSDSEIAALLVFLESREN